MRSIPERYRVILVPADPHGTELPSISIPVKLPLGFAAGKLRQGGTYYALSRSRRRGVRALARPLELRP